MAGEQYRTTVSIVFWNMDTDQSESLVDKVKSQIPEEDRSATIATVEFIKAGKPESPLLGQSDPIEPTV